MTTQNLKNIDAVFVNAKTEKAQKIMKAYYKSSKQTIWDAYKNPSKLKEKAYTEIAEEMITVNGKNMRITGAGKNFFSCAYVVKNIYNQEVLIYHAPSHKYAILLK